ncbi:hypothetical protein [Acanthamoeba polyphaga mimivirus]|uniref:Uncharacterized protein n=1 Tax=Acanthamoeba polyphaga mimivirus TaxID=212035 RepID=A0A0G2Y5U9_MIMIV|nr:hypothetical protein [Acanthamoeba polyphaga mimivirus]
MASFDYYSFRVEYVTKHINKEIEFYTQTEYNLEKPISEYVSYLGTRIGKDRQEQTVISQYDIYGNKQEIKKMNLNEYAKDMEVMMFKKPWTKLKPFHKIMKIKTYIDTLSYDKKIKEDVISKNKEELIDEITKGLTEKKFGTKNKSEIVYDLDKMEITNISCVDYDKKKKLYYIDWDL